MFSPYQRCTLAEQQRIDVRVFVNEVSRIAGDATFQSADPRLAMTHDITMEERVDYLRNLFAVDMHAPQPRYRWDHQKFAEVQFRRCLDLQEKLSRSGRAEGGLMEQLVDMLALPYLPQPIVIQGR